MTDTKEKKTKPKGIKLMEFFRNMNNQVNAIVGVADTCTIEALGLKDVPVELNLDKHVATIRVGESLYGTANALYGQNFNVVINKDYVFSDAFILEVTPLLNGFIDIKIKLNNFQYREKRDVNAMTFKQPRRLLKFDDYIASSPMCFEFIVNEQKFTVAMVLDNIFIYCKKSYPEKDFMEYADAIKLALGFVACDFPGGDEYYFSITGDIDNPGEIEYLSSYERSEEHDLNLDIFINTCRYLKDEFARTHNQETVIRLSQCQFNKLCDWIYEQNKELSLATALHYFAVTGLEGQELEHQLVMLACSFEALTRCIRGESAKNILKNEEQFDNLKNELKNTIDKEIKKLGFKQKEQKRLIDIFQAKLDNKFDNFISNNKKYQLPFDKHNIPYTPNKKTLQKRNSMLHGEPFYWDGDIGESFNKLQRELRTYQYCIIVIILKEIDYNGYIINPKRTEDIWNYINRIDNSIQSHQPPVNESQGYKDDFVVNLDFKKQEKSKKEEK